MVALPPFLDGFLFYDGQWNDISPLIRQTEQITITRGMTSEGQQADPSEMSLLLDNRDGRFSAKNPNSPLYGKIGRNTPMRIEIDSGTPWLMVTTPTGDDGISTPDNAALDITGDIDIRVDCRLFNWNNGFATELVCKNQTSVSGNQISWRLLQLAGGNIELTWSTDGTGAGGKTAVSTIPLFMPVGHRIAIKATLDVNNGLGGYTVNFYTAPTIAGPWTPLGDPVVTTAGTTSIFNSTSPIEVGQATGLQLRSPIGKFYAFQLRNGIDGTLVANLDIPSRTQGDTSWVDSTGRTWTVYGAGYITSSYVRLAGEVPAWPPRRSLSENDKKVPIKPTGILRRLSSGTKPLKSAAYRAIMINQDTDLLAYWPAEDEVNAQSIAAATKNTKPLIFAATGASLHADSSFLASDALPKMNKGRFTANIPTYTFTGSSQCRWLMKIPAAGVGTDAVICTLRSNGSVAEYRLTSPGVGSLRLAAYDAYGTMVGDSGSILFQPEGRAVRFHVGIKQSGANIEYTMAQLEQGQSSGVAWVSTFASLTAGAFTSVSFGDIGSGLGDTVMGHFSVNSVQGSLYDESAQLQGWYGESAPTRIRRLTGEQGIYRECESNQARGVQLGVQGIDTLVGLLSEAADADQGLLLDSREILGIKYRGISNLVNQQPAITLSYTGGQISPPFEPIDDDKLTENSIIVKVRDGSQSEPAVLSSGPLSIQDPPNGVGLYDISKEYNLNNATTANWIAGWRLARGTFNGLRYTSITINMANERIFPLHAAIMEADVGDVIRLTDLPADLPPDDVDLLIIGYSESIGPKEWMITFTCVPGEPYRTGGLQGSQLSQKYATNAYNRADLTGSTAYIARNSTDTDLYAINAVNSYIPWNHAYPVINSNSNMNSGTTNWLAEGGTLAVATPPAGAPFEAVNSLRFIPDGVTNPGGVASVTSGAGTMISTLSYYCHGWIWSSVDLADVRASIHWYNSSNVFISTSTGAVQTVPKETWTYIFGSMVAPANTDRGRARIRIGSAAPSNALIYMNDVRVRRDRTRFQPDEFPLDLRVSGEVVRATSCMPIFHDTFSRDTTNGWGTSESGQSFSNGGGVASDFSTNKAAAEGRHTMTTVNASRRSFINADALDIDAQCMISTSALATGASIVAGLTARHIDSSNLYIGRLEFNTNGTINVSIRKFVLGVGTTIANVVTGLTHVANTKYGLRFSVRGSTLRVKAWLASAPQPNQAFWHIDIQDADRTDADFWGTYSILSSGNTNVNPVVSYSEIRNNFPQKFLVERSINGVVKSLPAGSAINVDRPLITEIR